MGWFTPMRKEDFGYNPDGSQIRCREEHNSIDDYMSNYLGNDLSKYDLNNVTIKPGCITENTSQRIISEWYDITIRYLPAEYSNFTIDTRAPQHIRIPGNMVKDFDNWLTKNKNK